MLKAQRLVFALISGALFGFGLSVAQMIDPAKVINFLDIFGQWDPSLAFVMGGGLLVNSIATPLILRRERPILHDLFRIPSKNEIDGRLIGGSIVFGIGWALAGYCPGPMITSLSFVSTDILLVVGAYIIGTFITRWYFHRKDKAQHVEHLPDEACVG